MTTTTRGDVTAIGALDLAPAVRDGQPVVAVWAGSDGEPALLSIREALTLTAALQRTVQQALSLAADRLLADPP